MERQTSQRRSLSGLADIGGEFYPLALISGPCVIESEDLCLYMAEELAGIALRTGVLPIFKASFDKANRTSVTSFRGPGLEEGLRILEKVRAESGLPVTTDIHLPEQAAPAGEVVDVLQIPAFLCRQTDLLVAAGKTGKAVNVKKGQFVAPGDMKFAADKIASTGNGRILFTERGASFGYRDLVVDMRSLVLLADLGFPVVFDATHSVQRMGGEGGVSGGAPRFIGPLARAAVSTGAVSAVFIETHPTPEQALSDGANMLPLNELEPLVKQLVAIIEAMRGVSQAEEEKKS
ncbi:MAG: 3-deoxy-8-phosphooctulonate synthase [Calditrichaeota bacterium]|nr:3-deoxy-8-phosphooctulonate synthase [Calditrichota bacterium]MCB9366738.1 3-deoxy-8-phosphooctulonate synthase [Calditrichota bacterium]